MASPSAHSNAVPLPRQTAVAGFLNEPAPASSPRSANDDDDQVVVPSGPADWEAKKDIIGELYMTQNLILNDVMKIMYNQYRFKATARMYKGQFAKWRWSKYHKSRPGARDANNSPTSASTAATRPIKSRGTTRRRGTALAAPATHNNNNDDDGDDNNTCRETQMVTRPHAAASPVPASTFGCPFPPVLSLISDPLEMEATLRAYAAYISTWSARETPWKTDLNRTSVLQKVRLALDHFRGSRLGEGGAVLRGAFLQIEEAICLADMDVSAIWDCCLAVPQLALSSGWTDMLLIFTRYLDGLASVKLPARHPLATVAGTVSRLARRDQAALAHYIDRAWRLWVDLVRHQRGDADHVTIHLKRGYVILQTPDNAMVRTLIGDFARSVERSLAVLGPARTTSRILELEQLLTRMYLPLLTAESTARAERMLEGLLARISAFGATGEGPGSYLDRCLYFSAYHFLASIADFKGDGDGAANYRRRSLETPKDLFWLQTATTLEHHLRSQGRFSEADEIERERVVLEPDECQYPAL